MPEKCLGKSHYHHIKCHDQTKWNLFIKHNIIRRNVSYGQIYAAPDAVANVTELEYIWKQTSKLCVHHQQMNCSRHITVSCYYPPNVCTEILSAARIHFVHLSRFALLQVPLVPISRGSLFLCRAGVNTSTWGYLDHHLEKHKVNVAQYEFMSCF